MRSSGPVSACRIPPGQDLGVLELHSIVLSAFAQDKDWLNIHGGAVVRVRDNGDDENRYKDIHSLLFPSCFFLWSY